MQIQYVKGDATRPRRLGLILHCCNDIGGWGRGFVVALSKRWPHIEREYRKWAQDAPLDPSYTVSVTGPFDLGSVLFVLADHGIYVANLIGQHDIRWQKGVPPIRYPAIAKGLESVRGFCQVFHCGVHMPRMGAGLAGGDWSVIEKMVQEELCDWGIPVVVYDLP